MASKKYLNLEGLNQFLEMLSQKFASLIHQHDDRYYTETEIDKLVGTESVASQISESASVTLTSSKSYTDEQIEATTSLLDSKISDKANASDLTTHINNKSNPHNITLSQLGVSATAAELNALDGITATAQELNILDGATITAKELNYIDGVTGNIQAQLDTISGLIGDESVATQIENAMVAITNEEIDEICSSVLEVNSSLTDEVTGKNYMLYVSEGALKMTEVD